VLDELECILLSAGINSIRFHPNPKILLFLSRMGRRADLAARDASRPQNG